MALVFAPAANAVLSSVRRKSGQASGRPTRSARSAGARVWPCFRRSSTGAGDFGTPHAYVDGLVPAVWVGAVVLAIGALVALLVPVVSPQRRSPLPWRPRAGSKNVTSMAAALAGKRPTDGRNLTRQILREHLGWRAQPGEAISLRVDRTLLQDATGTMALCSSSNSAFHGSKSERALQYVDHNVIQLDFKNPDDHRCCRRCAAGTGSTTRGPGNGICHYVHLERYARPGGILGVPTPIRPSGALGMVAIGAGGLDVAVAMAGHAYEISCPEVVEVRLENTLDRHLDSGQGRDPRAAAPPRGNGRQEQDLRVHGPGAADLSVPERGTIANMIAELGATTPSSLPTTTLANARAPGARGRLRRDRARGRRRLRRSRGDRPGRARPAGGQAPQSRQRRAGRGGGRHADRAGLHRFLGELRLPGPCATGGRARRGRRDPGARAGDGNGDARIAADTVAIAESGFTASSSRAGCACSNRFVALRRDGQAPPRRPIRCARSTATSRPFGHARGSGLPVLPGSGGGLDVAR